MQPYSTLRKAGDRRSIRLSQWNYRRAGFYMITVVTHARRRNLAFRSARGVELTGAGRLVADCWHAIPSHFPDVRVDAFVVMPDHVHGIVRIVRSFSESVEAVEPGGSGSLGAVVRSFKSAATRMIRLEGLVKGSVWQRNYHERILRDADAIRAARRYIALNPYR